MRKRSKQEVTARFLSKFVQGPQEDCWIWTAGRFKAGYGQFNAGDGPLRAYYAHRFSYEHFIGPIPEGMFVCHLCDTPACVNPHHMFLGTPADNHRDMRRKGRSVSGFAIAFGKLTREQAEEIRAARKLGVSGAELARRYGIAQTTVCNIYKGRRHA